MKKLYPVVRSFPEFKNPVSLSSLDYSLQNKQQMTDLHIHPNFSDEEKTIEIYFSFPENTHDDFSSFLLDAKNLPSLNQLHCAVFIHGESSEGNPTTFYHFNQEALNLTGYTSEELLLKTPFDLSSESLIKQILPTLQKLVAQGMGTFRGEILHKSGKKIPVEGATVRILRDNEICFISFLNACSPYPENEHDLLAFNTLFDHSFIPICERDYSAVNDHFNHLKQSGVFDLKTHFLSHPEEVKKCISLVKTLKVNRAFIEAMECDSQNFNSIQPFIDQYLEKTYTAFCEFLVHLAERKTVFEIKMDILTPTKKIKNFLVRIMVVPGHEITLNRFFVLFLDLSPTQQIQECLIQSEKAFHLLTDNLTDPVQRFDSSGRCLFSSLPFELFTGIPCRDLLGRTYAEMGFSDSLCRFMEEELQRVLKTRKKSEKTFLFPLKKKETLCSWRFIPEFSEQGEILSVLCLIRDVSFFQIIADYHMMKMEQLELAVKIAGICFVEWKEEENRCYFGGSHREIFGRNMNEYKNMKEIYSLIHPDDLETLTNIGNRFFSEEKHIALEFRIFWPDGSIRWLKANSFSQFNPGSKSNRILSVLTDMTSRKEAEEQIFESRERFRQVTENINEVFSLYDLETHKQIYISPGFQKITGYTTLNFSGNQMLSEVVFQEDLPLLINAVNLLFAQKKEVHTEVRIKNKQGDLLWLKTKISPVFNKEGKLARIASLCTDITAHKEQAEKETLHREKMMQTEKLATLGMLISSIAHELNNPVNYLLLNTGIISNLWKKIQPVLDAYHQDHPRWSLSQISYPKTRSMLPDIFRGLEEGAQRINSLVSDLRNFIKKDNADLNQKIDLHAIIPSILPFCRELISKSTSDFQLLMAPELPPARGNPQQIEQVIMNLLTNSCQALTCKSQKIILETLHDKVSDHVGFRIRDEGMGISKHNLDKIREPFFTTKTDKGTGLGLSLVASIMENHRGTLDIVSTEGKGTVVTVWIPVYN